MKKYVTDFLLYFSIFFFSLTTVYAAPPPWEVEELMNSPAPDFTLEKLDNTTLTLSSLKGKVILVNFWATWCGPCLAEMPSLSQMYSELKQKDLVVVAISIDEKKSTVDHFLKKFPLEFPVVNDPNLTTAEAYKVFAYPTSFLIDRDGIVQKKYIGEQNWLAKELIDEINSYIMK